MEARLAIVGEAAMPTGFGHAADEFGCGLAVLAFLFSLFRGEMGERLLQR